MMMKAPALLLVLLISAAVLAYRAPTAMSACNTADLAPCLGAITGNGIPSAACCSKLRQQVPCFCQYFKNPTLRGYINSPNGKKVAAACSISTPSCR